MFRAVDCEGERATKASDATTPRKTQTLCKQTRFQRPKSFLKNTQFLEKKVGLNLRFLSARRRVESSNPKRTPRPLRSEHHRTLSCASKHKHPCHSGLGSFLETRLTAAAAEHFCSFWGSCLLRTFSFEEKPAASQTALLLSFLEIVLGGERRVASYAACVDTALGVCAVAATFNFNFKGRPPRVSWSSTKETPLGSPPARDALGLESLRRSSVHRCTDRGLAGRRHHSLMAHTQNEAFFRRRHSDRRQTQRNCLLRQTALASRHGRKGEHSSKAERENDRDTR